MKRTSKHPTMKHRPEKRLRITPDAEDFFQQALTTIDAIEESPTSVSTRKQLKEMRTVVKKVGKSMLFTKLFIKVNGHLIIRLIRNEC